MKILYGIQCTGNGHLTRSIKVINILKKMGHEIDILLSGNNCTIDIQHDVKWRFKGFTFFNTKNGGIDYIKTILSFNIAKFLKNINLDVSKYDKIITDFEPITAWACRIHNKKCYGLSNQYSFLSKKTPKSNRDFFGETILKWLAPVDKPIGLHYNEYDDFIHKPIISDDILNLNPRDKGHYTVYLPYYDITNIVNELTKFKQNFHIFHNNVGKNLNIYKNCILYPIDKNIFVNSFSDCHGIITNAGFQTTSEALYMSKKIMAIPVRGQFEQKSNIVSLNQMGIFSGKLDNIDNFLNSDKIIIDKWEDPVYKIIEYILS